MKSIIFVIIFSIVCFGCDREEKVVDDPLEKWAEIIPGEYTGGLEIFYGDSLYMEKITLSVQRLNEDYSLLPLPSSVVFCSSVCSKNKPNLSPQLTFNRTSKIQAD